MVHDYRSYMIDRALLDSQANGGHRFPSLYVRPSRHDNTGDSPREDTAGVFFRMAHDHRL